MPNDSAPRGFPAPRPTPARFVAHVAGSSVADARLAEARGDAVPDGLDRAALEAAVARREAREPLQHITGTAPFRTLTLEVGPGVFVPRPETEVVAGIAIDAAAAVAATGRVPEIADLCAGSGAIGLAVAAEVPRARVTMIELDADAFGYLERNLAASPPAVRERARAMRGDARTALADRDGTLDVVVSNPPYVPPGATPREPEVAEHDPAVALYGLGADGLEVPRGIAAAAARLLRAGGLFVIEHGEEQGPEVRAFLADGGAWRDIETRPDLTDRPRCSVARRA